MKTIRRNAVPIAVALGAFLLTSAVLLRFYVYEGMAMLPPETDLQLQMADEDAAYLDTSTWTSVRGVEVEQTTEISGRPAAGNPDWSTWQMTTGTVSGSTTLGHLDRRVIVDRTTGRAVNCCGEHVGGDRAVRQAGLVLHWPAGASGGDHPFYDADTRSAPPMRLEGSDEVAGVPVQRYVQKVDAAQVPGSARKVPASALGLEQRGAVAATRWVEIERVHWVEPVSGRLVDAAEHRVETLRGSSGGERTLLSADLELTEASVAAYAEAAATQRTLLTAVRTWIPMGAGALGGLVLAAAPLLALRRPEDDGGDGGDGVLGEGSEDRADGADRGDQGAAGDRSGAPAAGGGSVAGPAEPRHALPGPPDLDRPERKSGGAAEPGAATGRHLPDRPAARESGPGTGPADSSADGLTEPPGGPAAAKRPSPRRWLRPTR